MSLLTATPVGLGVIPGTIARTSTGTGAAWLPPDPNVDERYASANYEAQFTYHQDQYNASLLNIYNAYMIPIGSSGAKTH